MNLETVYVSEDSYALEYVQRNNLPYIILSFLFGDVDRNGEVNGIDAILLLQYLAEWETELDLAAADVNCDGVINGIDISIILQYLAEWDVELGKT